LQRVLVVDAGSSFVHAAAIDAPRDSAKNARISFRIRTLMRARCMPLLDAERPAFSSSAGAYGTPFEALDRKKRRAMSGAQLL
jgi:hypothetical protein